MREVGKGEPWVVLWPERQARSALLVSDLRVIRAEEVCVERFDAEFDVRTATTFPEP
jgi:hypothetical protein